MIRASVCAQRKYENMIFGRERCRNSLASCYLEDLLVAFDRSFSYISPFPLNLVWNTVYNGNIVCLRVPHWVLSIQYD